MDSTHGRGGGTSPPASSFYTTPAVPAPFPSASSSFIDSSAPPKASSHATYAQPSPLSTYVSTYSANGVSSSFSSTSSTSLNYGDEEEAAPRPLHSDNKQLKPPRLIVTTDQGGKVRMPPAAQTWRDWSPVRRPATGSGTGRKKHTTDEEEGLLTARRSMDWSEMRGERLKGKEKGVQSGRKKTKAKKKKKNEKDNVPDDESHSEGDSESESESSSGSSEDEPTHKAKTERKKKDKAKKKSKGSENGHGHGHGHGHGEHKKRKKKHGDIENQLKPDKAHKKRRKKKKGEPSDYLPIYLDRERRVIPLMEPLPQVIGFVVWQVATFVLGLSLGIFLSGITPGYDVADVGINSHWWNVDLKKPVFQPPDEMLAPVWLSTFFLAAVGMWVVWRRGGWKWNKLATSLYLIHLFIFQIWLCMFFFLHGLLLSVLTAMLGWALMLVCLIAFLKRSWVAFGLLSFAFLWKTFIVLDVLVIWWINSGELTRQT